MSTSSIAILGCGNIGSAIATGLVKSGIAANNITLTRRKAGQLSAFQQAGYHVTEDNGSAVNNAKIILLAV